jgi:hypothetical protein
MSSLAPPNHCHPERSDRGASAGVVESKELDEASVTNDMERYSHDAIEFTGRIP